MVPNCVSTAGPVSWRLEPLGGAAPAVVVVVCAGVVCAGGAGVVTFAAPDGLNDGLDEPHAASSTDADTAAVERNRFTA